MPRADDPAFTAARGVAALWVFVYHVWLSVGPQRLLVPFAGTTLDLTPLASVGWAGVDVFYVLSGFLLWGAFDDYASRRTDAIRVARFAKRRALRILPPFYAQVALLAVLGLATTWVEPASWTTLALHATLTHGLSYQHFQSVNNVWWTLSIEAQFYVALPLLAMAIRRYGWATVLAGGLAAMLAFRIAAFAAFRDAPVIEKVWALEQFPGRVDQFLAGMLASHLARARDGSAARLRAALADATALRVALACVGPVTLVALGYLLHVDDFYLRYWDGHPWVYAWHLVAGIGIAISFHAIAVRPGADTGAPMALPWRTLSGLGLVSYSFYLWHELLLRWLSAWIKAVWGAATLPALGMNFALGLPLALAVAVAWFALFEAPFLRARATLRG
jgi:peptidoglycan/LPS O-acetylase OafA/YrhL